MSTQLEKALNREVTEEMKLVAGKEGADEKELLKNIAGGHVVIPANRLHRNLEPMGIGKGLRIKVNSNIGTSPSMADLKKELEKLRISIEAGADTVMDLSTGGDIDSIRRQIIRHSKIPVGTVPVYQPVVERGSIIDLSEKDFVSAVKKHMDDGVDFVTIHAGFLKETIPLVKKRLMGVVSRGGSFLMKWMDHHGKENPLYTRFDELLEHARKNDVTFSLGDGLRPGCIKDATDKAQIHELKVLGRLSDRAFNAGVQSMIEGPGHVPLHQVKKNVDMQKKICKGKPFYVLGPVVTDVAPGYDHITSSIGGALAAYHGADFLCYVTPREHLGLPNLDDVREGVIASRIAAHAVDIARGRDSEWDHRMSKARAGLDWKEMMKLAMDPGKAERMRKECFPQDTLTCSMCDRFCSVKISKEIKGKDKNEG